MYMFTNELIKNHYSFVNAKIMDDYNVYKITIKYLASNIVKLKYCL